MKRIFRSVFYHWWLDSDLRSVGRFIWLLLSLPVLLVKLVLHGGLVILVIYQIIRLPSNLRAIARTFREATALGQTDRSSTRMKGGGYQKSYLKGSLIRSGGSFSSDDLLRRLDELRTPHERRKRRTPKTGGQNGKQK